jgi:hypothetical protein
MSDDIKNAFTVRGLIPDANLTELLPSTWRADLTQLNFDIVFVESAWFGRLNSWYRKVSHLSFDLQELLSVCRSMSIPTVFWSKEDPIHFHRFFDSAKNFDFIFTADLNSIGLYKTLSGRGDVYLLPFSFQQRMHNPLESFFRVDSVCFAGSYYHGFPNRVIDFNTLFRCVTDLLPFDIYDRYGADKSCTNYRFPPSFLPFVKGSLPPDQMDIAYKGYTYGINLNTVKNSESMFARRVFELLGSGTVVISNESPGIRFLFGDLVITSDNADEIRQRLQELVDNPVLRSKVALAGVRKVLLEHTYAHRLERVYSIVFGTPEKKQTLPPVCVLASISSVTELQRLQQMLLAQEKEVDWRAVLIVADGADIASMQQAITDERISCVFFASAAQQGMAGVLADAQWAAGWNANDYYGPNYLLDLLLGTRYCDAPVLGKAAMFCADAAGPKWVNQEAVYRPMAHVQARCAVIKAERLVGVSVAEWLGFVASGQSFPMAMAEGAMALDAFSYCQDAWLQGLAQADVSAVVDDLELNKGRSIDELYAKAEAMPVHMPAWLGKPAWRLQNLAQAFGTANEGATLHGTLDKFGWHLVSEIPDGNHAFIWAENALPIEELGGQEGLKFHVVEGPGLPIELMVRFETERGGLVAEEMFETNQNQQWTVPDGGTHVRLGFRVFSSGTTRVMRFVLGWL